jgi:hypothetical protein
MDEKEFNKLDRKEKLSLIYYKALEIDNIYPWSGNLRIVTIYKLDEFLIELVCDLNNKGITEINTFKSLNYLEKYPRHFDKIRNLILTELNK